MNILVSAATEMEIAAFLGKLRENGPLSKDLRITTLITGVGAVNTTYQLTKLSGLQRFQFAIQAGIAGTFTDDLNKGDVVAVSADCFGDLGTEEKDVFQTIFQAGFGNENAFPYKDGWLVNEHPILQQSLLKTVKAVTVNKVSDSIQQKQQLVNSFDPAVESMEGAAFHFVCLQENIPFIQLRAISNQVGDRNKANWDFKNAIANLNDELEKLVSKLASS